MRLAFGFLKEEETILVSLKKQKNVHSVWSCNESVCVLYVEIIVSVHSPFGSECCTELSHNWREFVPDFHAFDTSCVTGCFLRMFCVVDGLLRVTSLG